METCRDRARLRSGIPAVFAAYGRFRGRKTSDEYRRADTGLTGLPRRRRGVLEAGPCPYGPGARGDASRAGGPGGPGREPGSLGEGLGEHEELQGRQRLFYLALQDYGQHLPELPTPTVAPQDARGR